MTRGFPSNYELAENVFQVLETNREKKKLTVCNLEHNSYHNFSVECLPAFPRSGFWSDAVYLVNFYVEESGDTLLDVCLHLARLFIFGIVCLLRTSLFTLF